MPTYVYEIISADGSGAGSFEWVQSIHAPPLTHHPETGEPVRRIITAPNLVLRHGARQEKQIMSNENIAAKGFTKYERSGPGSYVRTAGTQGPSTLSADE